MTRGIRPHHPGGLRQRLQQPHGLSDEPVGRLEPARKEGACRVDRVHGGFHHPLVLLLRRPEERLQRSRASNMTASFSEGLLDARDKLKVYPAFRAGLFPAPTTRSSET